MARNDTVARLRDGSPLHWLLILVAVALAGVHLYVGLAAPFVAGSNTAVFVFVAVAFLVGLAVYLSPYWRPVLYLLGVLLSLYLGQLWLFGGARYLAVGVVTGVVSLAFLALNLYLFYREGPFSAEGG